MLRGKGADVILLAIVLTTAAVTYALEFHHHPALVLTGVVETNSLAVSLPLAGRVDRLLVAAGDPVARDQLIALIAPAEASPAPPRAPQVQPTAATPSAPSNDLSSELTFENQQAADAADLANRSLEATTAQQLAADSAVTQTLTAYERLESLSQEGLVALSQVGDAKAAYDEACSRVEALTTQERAEQSALALARSNARHVEATRAETAQRDRASVTSGVMATAAPPSGHVVREIRAPIDGVVDTAPVRQGDSVDPGQPLVTLINPDDLWVRADVARSEAGRIHLGDRLTVRIASGEEREGTVFYCGAAGDARGLVEIRLRIENGDRSLEPGIPAYVTLSAAPSLRPAP